MAEANRVNVPTGWRDTPRPDRLAGGAVELWAGDCTGVLKALEAGSVDAVIADPPYALGFMGCEWDGVGDTGRGARARAERASEVTPKGRGHATSAVPYLAAGVDSLRSAGRPFQDWCGLWAPAALRVLKPGGYMLAFGGTRTFHRLACALEDAGFEMRDTLCWLYGSGFPKGKACLKPAWEPILLARKPGGRVEPLNIDAARVPLNDERPPSGSGDRRNGNIYAQDEWTRTQMANGGNVTPDAGRWPANVVHDGSDEVLEAFTEFGEKSGDGAGRSPRFTRGERFGYSGPATRDVNTPGYDDSGTAARFFFCAKASSAERPTARDGTKHPTVKPVELMRWLVRLVAQPGETILDPFAGSGTTGEAALAEGCKVVLVEREPKYVEMIRKRLARTTPSLFNAGRPDVPGGP